MDRSRVPRLRGGGVLPNPRAARQRLCVCLRYLRRDREGCEGALRRGTLWPPPSAWAWGRRGSGSQQCHSPFLAPLKGGGARAPSLRSSCRFFPLNASLGAGVWAGLLPAPGPVPAGRVVCSVRLS